CACAAKYQDESTGLAQDIVCRFTACFASGFRSATMAPVRSPVQASLGPGKILQRLNRYGNDIGTVPRRRDPYDIGHETHCPSEQYHHDCHDPSVAIEHGRARSTVIEHEAVIPIVHLEKCRAG